jgi:hypothetical protein
MPPHVTVTGQIPVVVFVPMVQLQETVPLASVVFGTSPCARLGPVRYSATIVQGVFGTYRALIEAVEPRETDPGSLVMVNATGVGVAVAGAAVGGRDVAVGGTDMGVGGSSVGVGGTAVALGGVIAVGATVDVAAGDAVTEGSSTIRYWLGTHPSRPSGSRAST